MKKDAPQVDAARDAVRDSFRALASFPFRIVTLQRVAYGSKTAEFLVETPLGVFEADLFAPEGREPFVQTRSVRDKYTGQWRRTVTLDRAFAVRVLAALCVEAPNAEAKGGEPRTQSIEPSETLLKSEREFDAAFTEFDGQDGAT